MNTPSIDFSERIQQNHGLISDFPSHSSQYFGNQQAANMGIRLQPSAEAAGSLQQQNFRPLSSIVSRFESPASAFYATERYMGFPQYDYQVSSSPVNCSHFSNSQISSHQFPAESYSISSGDHRYESSESCNGLFGSSPENKLQSLEQNKLLSNGSTISMSNRFSAPFQEHLDHRVGCNSYKSPFQQLCFSSQQEKQSPIFSSGASSGNHVSTGAALANKMRIRWTQDLHEKFVECVNRLGGADKATPKAILKLMDSDGLTIFHVKSHLQKYRIAKYIPDSSEGKAEKRTSINDVPQLDMKTGFQIREALQLQLDVQRRLHEQLEIQRNLQLRIEEQGKQLKMMIDQQVQKTSSASKNPNTDITPTDASTFSPEDVGFDFEESSNNTQFPSKIS